LGEAQVLLLPEVVDALLAAGALQDLLVEVAQAPVERRLVDREAAPLRLDRDDPLLHERVERGGAVRRRRLGDEHESGERLERDRDLERGRADAADDAGVAVARRGRNGLRGGGGRRGRQREQEGGAGSAAVHFGAASIFDLNSTTRRISSVFWTIRFRTRKPSSRSYSYSIEKRTFGSTGRCAARRSRPSASLNSDSTSSATDFPSAPAMSILRRPGVPSFLNHPWWRRSVAAAARGWKSGRPGSPSWASVTT